MNAPTFLDLPAGSRLAIVHTPPTGTVAAAIDRWLDHVQRCGELPLGEDGRLSPRTVVSYAAAAAKLRPAFGRRRVSTLTRGDVLTWLIEEVSPGSRHAVGCAVSAWLHWVGSPEVMPDGRHWRNRIRPLEWDPADYSRAFAALLEGLDRVRALRRPTAVQLCSLLVAVTGLRVGEAVPIRRRDVASSWITVNGKSGERRIPRTEHVSAILDQCPPATRWMDWVFPAARPSSTGHVLESSVSHWVLRCARRAGLSGLHTHVLRHWYASWLASKGYPLTLVSRMLGHSSVSTTERYYVHVAIGEQAAAAEALGHALTGGQLDLF